MIFRDVADGCGYNVVLNKLNSMGYRTRLGNTFSKETLYEMLRNEKYNGVYVFSRAASKDELGRRNNHLDKPIEDQIRIPGGMPKIVDDETFACVQAILASRKRHRRQKSKRNYLLTGLVFCGLCGHRYCGDSMQSGSGTERIIMEKIKITAEDGEIIELFVIEQTRLEGINYLLVTETEDEEAEAYILKDISSDDDKEAVYEFVDDDNELDTLAKLFSELIEDTEII